jgi:hypothetical protein
MEAIVTFLQGLQLNIFQVSVAGCALFILGYSLANRKTRKLSQKIASLQNDVLDLNAELLYGRNETPVIELRNITKQPNKLAK